jgi:hypothetical protein
LLFLSINNYIGDPVGLAKEVLEEVPVQFLQYMQLVGIEPGPPTQAGLEKSEQIS